MSLRGHHRGGVLVGFALTVGAVLGVMGLLGESPLDLRGDETPLGAGDARPWWQREGTLVVLFSALLYLPFAGAFGLWDPWETHYAEVAREILSRDDWITLWWAQEGWFMSKPVLVFWMAALGMGTGSLFTGPHFVDQPPGVQEWFIRVPIAALAIAALYGLHRAVARAWGKRAGLLVAMVLATMPHWFFLAHQAMTDMPFVAPLVLAMSALMQAITSAPEARARPYAVTLAGRRFRVTLWHLTVGLVLLVSLPQITYLLTRPMVTACPDDADLAQCHLVAQSNRVFNVQLPFETYFIGSAGNSSPESLAASVPGSPRWERLGSVVPFMPSMLQGVVWLLVLLGIFPIFARERRTQALHFVLFYFWCAISTMGKGPAGLVIPGTVALLHYVSSGRWRDLLQVRLGLGVAVFLVVGMPWYVAITGRLGGEFLQRFVVHDLINRATLGVHGDTGSVRYFLWQLGYAMFPWSGLVPMALFGWRFVVPREATDAQRDVARIALLWFALAFTLFSAMITKFHHYIFPAVPAAAIAVGLLLERAMGPATGIPFGFRVRMIALQGAALVLAVLGAARLMGTFSGLVPQEGSPPATPTLGAAMLVAAGALWFFGLRIERAYPLSSTGEPTSPEESVGFAVLALGAVAIVVSVTRDFVTTRSAIPGSERLIHLFVYNYDRPWPSRVLDYRAALFGFGAVATVSMLALASRRLRPYAARGAVVFAALFAFWGLDVYMVQVTPHWSQRQLFERYYALRQPTNADPRFTHDPIVAHQMNWKGENFYTGNRVVAEECGLKYCTGSTAEFLRGYRGQRVFFITEHARLGGLQSIIRNAGGEMRAITTDRDNNKFVLVEGHFPHGPSPSAERPNEPRWGSKPPR
jgi:4-amino-4-deoxy-L-arabinose transferase-like glycosyltransferase